MIRIDAAVAILLAAWGAAAQPNQPASAAHKPATEGARELFYLAVAQKDKLPPITKASLSVPKKAPSAADPAAGAGVAPAPAVHLGIRYNLVLVDQNNQTMPVESDRIFHKGDHVAIEIESNRSGYLYVLARQSSGAWQALLPSPEMADESNVIDPGRKIRVPEAYYFEIQDPPGSEHLMLVFSRDPQDFYELYQGIRKQNSAPAGPAAPMAPPVAPDSLMADASRVNSAVARMQSQFGGRDIAIRKVSQPLSAGEPAGSVYVVNASDKPSSSVVTEIVLKH